MVKNGPLQAGMIRQSRGAEASGNAKAVSKVNAYRAPIGPVTGRTAASKPVAPPAAKQPAPSPQLPKPAYKKAPNPPSC